MAEKTSSTGVLPDHRCKGDIALKKQSTLRKLVGILGILLPVFVYLFLQLTDNFNPILPSISHYYFTRAAAILEIIVSLLAVFLLIYKGEERIDFVLSAVAGLSALMMLIFPTDNLQHYLGSDAYDRVAVTFFEGSGFRPKLHYFCAALFLLSLASMALFLFTKSDEPPSKRTFRKKIRNRIYRICGSVMLAAMVTAFLGFLKIIPSGFYDANNLTFWMECLSVEAFGIAWMVKGELVLADKK